MRLYVLLICKDEGLFCSGIIHNKCLALYLRLCTVGSSDALLIPHISYVSHSWLEIYACHAHNVVYACMELRNYEH